MVDSMVPPGTEVTAAIPNVKGKTNSMWAVGKADGSGGEMSEGFEAGIWKSGLKGHIEVMGEGGI